MTKYSSSSSYSNYEATILSIIIILIGVFLAKSLEDVFLKTLTIIVSLGIIGIIIIIQRKRTFEIKFLEDEIIIKYIFLKKFIIVPYKNLLQIDFISISKSPDRNRIKFIDENKVKSLSFFTIANSDKYIEFIKWLKSKNEKIELKVYPSSHLMNHRIQEVYGFKYRKKLKKTL